MIDNEKTLSGLPQGVIAAAAETARKRFGREMGIHFAESQTMPFLQHADNRNLREQIYKALYRPGQSGQCTQQLGQHQQNGFFTGTISLAVEGFPRLMPAMSSTIIWLKIPENVYRLCNRIWEAALPISGNRSRELQKMIDKNRRMVQTSSRDWRYYAEKLKKRNTG